MVWNYFSFVQSSIWQLQFWHWDDDSAKSFIKSHDSFLISTDGWGVNRDYSCIPSTLYLDTYLHYTIINTWRKIQKCCHFSFNRKSNSPSYRSAFGFPAQKNLYQDDTSVSWSSSDSWVSEKAAISIYILWSSFVISAVLLSEWFASRRILTFQQKILNLTGHVQMVLYFFSFDQKWTTINRRKPTRIEMIGNI